MTSTQIDIRGLQVTADAAARTRSWLPAAFGSHHAAAIEPMPSTYVVKTHNGIRHRPPEVST